jgi:nucleotidyltransferase substrate binding protein (TIGR01987 family)
MNNFFETLNIIRPIVDQIMLIEGIDAIYLFGSRAKGNSQKKSDIDLAIICPKINEDDWGNICEIINNAQTLIKIDCVRFDTLSLNSPLRADIEKDKIVIFQAQNVKNYDLKFVFLNVEKALTAFRVVVEKPMDSDLINIDSTIQRFEFTVELFWKLLKKILLSQGVQTQYPKDVLKEAYAGELIQDEKIWLSWLSMLNDRNQTSHTYDQPLALLIYARMPIYLDILEKTFKELKDNYINDEDVF